MLGPGRCVDGDTDKRSSSSAALLSTEERTDSASSLREDFRCRLAERFLDEVD